MKKLALAAAVSVIATGAFAGNMAEPVMESDVVVEEATSSSSGGILVPLLLVILVAAAVAD